MLQRFLLGLLLHTLTTAALAAPAPDEPGAELSIHVMTMGQGDAVWERFGHNTIWLRDARRGIDPAYNWGLFDFEQENFLWNFFQGRMIYWMEGFGAGATAWLYEQSDRSVWIQQLNLTPRQREELRQFLLWNEQPANRSYRYDYFLDNCSTRVRDALDRVLDGQIRRQTDHLSTGMTFRSHTRRIVADDLLWYTLLHTLLGPYADREISVWEEMFLPMQMQAHLRRIMVADEQGEPVPLVAAEWTHYQSTRPPPAVEPPNYLIGFLTTGLLIGAVSGALGWLARRRRAARWPLAAISAVWLLYSGIIGFILTWGWAFTDHVAGYANENLFQHNLLALPLAVMLPAAALGWRRMVRWAWWLMIAIAALSLVGLMFKVLPAFAQVNGEIIALALPVHLGLVWGVYELRRAGRAAGTGATPKPGAHGRQKGVSSRAAAKVKGKA